MQSAEWQLILAANILKLLNKAESRATVIGNILYSVKTSTGFEAVGIRLREGNDFPYYKTGGFSSDFVKAETYLCQKDPGGELVHDSTGNPLLECMCGTVISQRTDPSQPFFTEGGSFWTNSTSALLASTTEADRQGRTRNRCNAEGYECVALIPLRCDNQIIGLLQLNDRRVNLLTREMIEFFESVGSSIGIALKLTRGDIPSRRPRHSGVTGPVPIIPSSEERASSDDFFHNAPVSFLEQDLSAIRNHLDTLRKKGIQDIRAHVGRQPEEIPFLANEVRITAANKAALEMFEVESIEQLRSRATVIFNKESYEAFKRLFLALADGMLNYHGDGIIMTHTAMEKHVLINYAITPGSETSLSSVLVTLIDISPFKHQTKQLEATADKYRHMMNSGNDIIILADRETGIIIDANSMAEELLECSIHELVGTHVSELHPEEAAEDYQHIFGRHVQEQKATLNTLFTCKKCRKTIPVSVSSGIMILQGREYVTAIFRPSGDRGTRLMKTVDASPVRGSNAVGWESGPLSIREREVLSLIASGRTNRQIAEKLFISEKTVITHRSKIMKKLDVHKTADLVRYALSSGILMDHPHS